MFRLITAVVILIAAWFYVSDSPPKKHKKIPLSKPTPVEQFMKKVAYIESGNNHRITNEFGMMGKYQFSPSTVRTLGFRVSNKNFLADTKLQDTVMLAYMKANHRELKPLIKKYDGKIVKGIKVTRAGILAGAHFAGSGGVVVYFNTSGNGITDARGTTVKKYMSYFSNFTLPEIL